jgi:ABC-type multidrug transport system permease subunit
VLLQSAAFGGVFTGFGIAADFEHGFARRLFLAAPRRTGIILGYALASVARWVFMAALLTVVAWIAGLEIGGNGVDVVALYTLALLVNLSGVLWSCGIAMRLRTMQAGPLMQMPTFMVLFFAPVYVPIELMASWLAFVAEINPITQVLEAARSLLAGEPSGVAIAFLVGVGLVTGFSLWAFRGLRRAEAAGA